MTAQYREMAALYDWPDAIEFSHVMFRRTRAAFRRFGIAPPARVCDLACGTGTLGLLLADEGYRVTGLDLSPAMLRIARRKSRGHANRPSWRTADMRRFRLRRPARAVTCYYDAINHLLTKRDVTAALRRVFTALAPGGLFCFDANRLFCFEEFWDGAHQMEHADAVQFIDSQFQPRTGRATATVTGFVPVGRNRYRKFVERVDERYYSADVWRGALRRVGFVNVSFEEFDPWRHGGADTMKWFVTAVKPAA